MFKIHLLEQKSHVLIVWWSLNNLVMSEPNRKIEKKLGWHLFRLGDKKQWSGISGPGSILSLYCVLRYHFLVQNLRIGGKRWINWCLFKLDDKNNDIWQELFVNSCQFGVSSGFQQFYSDLFLKIEHFNIKCYLM